MTLVLQRLPGYDTKGTGNRKKADTLDFMKIFKFRAPEDPIQRVKSSHRMGENIGKSYI